MKERPPAPPSVRLATPESLRGEDPSRQCGRWPAIALSAGLFLLLWLRIWFERKSLAPVPVHWAEPRTWAFDIVPLIAGVIAALACCLRRKPRAVLLMFTGFLLAFGMAACNVWYFSRSSLPIGGAPRIPPAFWWHAALILTFLLMLGGLDAARRVGSVRTVRTSLVVASVAVALLAAAGKLFDLWESGGLNHWLMPFELHEQILESSPHIEGKHGVIATQWTLILGCAAVAFCCAMRPARLTARLGLTVGIVAVSCSVITRNANWLFAYTTGLTAAVQPTALVRFAELIAFAFIAMGFSMLFSPPRADSGEVHDGASP